MDDDIKYLIHDDTDGTTNDDKREMTKEDEEWLEIVKKQFGIK